MSAKHNQRPRAQILAKRQQPIAEIRVQHKTFAPNGQWLYVPQPTHSERLRAAFDASKYIPTYGENRQRRTDERRQQRIEALAA